MTVTNNTTERFYNTDLSDNNSKLFFFRHRHVAKYAIELESLFRPVTYF